MKKSITTNDVIKLLNGANNSDPNAISTLFLRRRARCNRKLADHKSIQVRARRGGKPPYTVGILGIINGAFGTDAQGMGPIVMVVDKGRIIRFKRIKK